MNYRGVTVPSNSMLAQAIHRALVAVVAATAAAEMVAKASAAGINYRLRVVILTDNDPYFLIVFQNI